MIFTMESTLNLFKLDNDLLLELLYSQNNFCCINFLLSL